VPLALGEFAADERAHRRGVHQECFMLERCIPGWTLPRMSFGRLVVAINLVQLSIVLIAEPR
jgi:hypothetical protein